MKTTAQIAYEAAQAQSQLLIKRLESALARHAQRAEAYPADWSYVGSLNCYNSGIAECLNSLGAQPDD